MIPKLTQTIRGIVVDSKTNTPIEYASVCITEDPSRGGSTDERGNFRINNVPVGRYNIQQLLWGIAQVSSPKRICYFFQRSIYRDSNG